MGLAQGARAQSAPAAGPPAAGPPGDFETFTLPKEPTAAPSTGPTPGNMPIPPRLARPLPSETVNTQFILSLFQGGSDLSINMAGTLLGRQLDSQLNPSQWLQGDFSNPGYLEVGSRGRGFRFGDTYSKMLGSAQGARLFAPWKTDQGTLGIGLYQRFQGGAGRGGGIMPALDSQWKLREGWDGGMLLASDSSWRLTQEAQGPSWSFYGFAGFDARSRQPEDGLMLEQRLARGTTAQFRAFRWGGDQPGFSGSAGLSRQFGRSTVSLDQVRQWKSDGDSVQTSLGFFMPFKREMLALRWQRNQEQTGDELGPRDRTADMFMATVVAPLNERTTVWAGGTAQREKESSQTLLTLGGSRSLGRRWSVQAELTHNLELAQPGLRFGVGYMLNPDLQLRLLYGPPLRPTTDAAGKNVFGLQIVRTMRFVRTQSGTVRGRVLLDGKPYTEKIALRLDGDVVAQTDGSGKFQIRRIPPGTHNVSLVLTTLAANVSADDYQRTVELKAGKSEEVQFSLNRVGRIRGAVQVAPDAFGAIDPTAGTGIVVTAGEGRDSTTNAENEFVLGNLTAGKYRLSLVPATLPRDYEVVGPQEIEVEVDPAAPPPVVQFKIAPRTKKIDFGDGGK